MTDKELSLELDKFLKAKCMQKNFWQTETGKVIFQHINARGNFKKAASGNPAKGYRKMKEYFARQNGWEPGEDYS